MARRFPCACSRICSEPALSNCGAVIRKGSGVAPSSIPKADNRAWRWGGRAGPGNGFRNCIRPRRGDRFNAFLFHRHHDSSDRVGREGRVDMEMEFSRAADGIGARFRLR
jgi:hypothetical protein